MNKNQSDDEAPEGPNRRRVTLRDIAKELGISHVSVSRALRDEPCISDNIKARVKLKAEEMGYSPDPMLSALSNYRLTNKKHLIQSSLAWINLFERPEELREYRVFDLYWQGATDTARQLGFHLEEFKWVDIPARRLHDIFKARGIQGVVLSPSSFTDEQLRDKLAPFPWEDYTTIRFGQSARFLNVHYISSAQAANTVTAFERVREKGYERIGFVGEYLRKFFFSAGYLWAQQAVPENLRLPPFFCKSNEVIQRKDDLHDWIKRTQPDAIICGAAHVLGTLESLGYRIPEDIALCTLVTNDTSINAGIDQNPKEIGRAAIRSLVSQLNENHFGIPPTQNEILVEGHWVDGSMLPDKR